MAGASTSFALFNTHPHKCRWKLPSEFLQYTFIYMSTNDTLDLNFLTRGAQAAARGGVNGRVRRPAAPSPINSRQPLTRSLPVKRATKDPPSELRRSLCICLVARSSRRGWRLQEREKHGRGPAARLRGRAGRRLLLRHVLRAGQAVPDLRCVHPACLGSRLVLRELDVLTLVVVVCADGIIFQWFMVSARASPLCAPSVANALAVFSARASSWWGSRGAC